MVWSDNMFTNRTQGEAEDIILWHRFHYYVESKNLVSDAEFDSLERELREKWPICLSGIGGSVGSDDPRDYPEYIRQKRRPQPAERKARDKAIVDRWLAHL